MSVYIYYYIIVYIIVILYLSLFYVQFVILCNITYIFYVIIRTKCMNKDLQIVSYKLKRIQLMFNFSTLEISIDIECGNGLEYQL